MIHSGYKTELSHDDIESFVFTTYDAAHTAMTRLAREVYESDDIIQEEDDKYFDECEDCIYFGENQSYGIGYRSAWGMAKLQKVTVNQ